MRLTETVFLCGSRAVTAADTEGPIVLSNMTRLLAAWTAEHDGRATIVSTSVVATVENRAVATTRGPNVRPQWRAVSPPGTNPITVRQIPYVKARISRCGSPLDAFLIDLGQTVVVPGRAAVSLVGPDNFRGEGFAEDANIPVIDPNGPWDFWRAWVSYDVADAGALAGAQHIPRLTESFRFDQGQGLAQTRLVPPNAQGVTFNGAGIGAAATSGVWLAGANTIGQFNIQTAAVFPSTEIAVPPDATAYTITAAAATRVSVHWRIRP